MIKPNEVRIGNWLYSVDKENNKFKFDVSCITAVGILAHPIPLSPLILENYGFKKSNEFGDVWYLMEDGLYLEIQHDSCWWWSIDDCGDNEGSKLREIKYEHQLQNLYFVLTERDLKIKP